MSSKKLQLKITVDHRRMNDALTRKLAELLDRGAVYDRTSRLGRKNQTWLAR